MCLNSFQSTHTWQKYIIIYDYDRGAEEETAVERDAKAEKLSISFFCLRHTSDKRSDREHHGHINISLYQFHSSNTNLI